MNAEIEFLLRDALARRGIVPKKVPPKPTRRRAVDCRPSGQRVVSREPSGQHALRNALTASISSQTTECGIG